MSVIVEVTSQTKSRLIDIHGWNILRVFIGLVILTAAFMKAHQLATPTLGEGFLHARWFNILVWSLSCFSGFGFLQV